MRTIAVARAAISRCDRIRQSYCSFDPCARTGRDSRCSHRCAATIGFNPRARTGRDSSRKIPRLSCALGSVSANAT